MKILIDTNIIIDIALKIEPFFQYANDIFFVIENNNLQSFISATTITDIYYVVRKERGHANTILFLKKLLLVTDVAGVNKQTILQAINSDINDFEDAIQIFAAKNTEIDAIVTRNKKDFKQGEVIVYTPTEFLTMIKQGK